MRSALLCLALTLGFVTSLRAQVISDFSAYTDTTLTRAGERKWDVIIETTFAHPDLGSQIVEVAYDRQTGRLRLRQYLTGPIASNSIYVEPLGWTYDQRDDTAGAGWDTMRVWQSRDKLLIEFWRRSDGRRMIRAVTPA